MRVTDILYEADRPVAQSRARALAVNEAIREPISEYLDNQQSKRRMSVGVAVVGVLLGIIAFALNAGALVAAALIVGGLAAGGGGFAYVRAQEPAVTVNRVQKGYWTGHCIPDEEGVVVYDASASLDSTSFELERLADDEVVTSAHQRLDELGEFPVVMDSGENVEERFTDALDDVRDTIANAQRHTVEAPIVPAEGPEASGIEFFLGVADTDAEAVQADVEVSAADARKDVEALADIERMAADDSNDTELEELAETSQQLVSDLSGLQETAIDLLNDHVNTAADAFGLVSYNFYCPDCQLDDIDSQVTLSDPQTGEWHCETCRNSHQTEAVIPRHGIKDDVVNPVWDQLWIEKDDQRREIYENIEDKKENLQEREFEQRREEIRSAGDRIKDLRSRIRDLKTEAKAAEGTVSEIGDLMVKYERLHEQRKEQFQQDVEESFAEIDEQTDQILEETRNEEQERIQTAQEEAKQKAALMREEERRRQVEKFIAEQQMESARTRAQMEQRAELHGEEMELEEQHHRENWMIETRGGTSFCDFIDKAKMTKDRLPGFRATAHTDGGGN